MTKTAINLIKNLSKNRKLISTLSRKDLTSSYTANVLGFFWIFVEPSIYMILMWFIFNSGFKVTAPGPNYFTWMMPGMVVWFFFSQCLNSLTNVFASYSYMLKQPDFEISQIVLIPIFSLSFIHFIFIVLLMGVLLLSGVVPNFKWLEFVLFYVCTLLLLVPLGLIVGSISLFLRDLKNMISVGLQLLFWLSPIFWNIDNFNPKLHWMIKLNPLYFIMTGYRRAFLPEGTVVTSTLYEVAIFVFWLILLYAMADIIYRRLRPHFGDVL